MEQPHTREIFINRELSWLKFNQRVLEQSIDNSIPLFASLEATLFLGESITLPQMIGGVLIIGGICYASFGDLYAARRLLK